MTRSPAPVSRLVARGMTLHAGSQTWSARCLDARMIAGWRWVEVALSGLPDYTVVLKISMDVDHSAVARALEWWLRTPGHETGDVIEVI
jgi:hypothetical protein